MNSENNNNKTNGENLYFNIYEIARKEQERINAERKKNEESITKKVPQNVQKNSELNNKRVTPSQKDYSKPNNTSYGINLIDIARKEQDKINDINQKNRQNSNYRNTPKPDDRQNDKKVARKKEENKSQKEPSSWREVTFYEEKDDITSNKKWKGLKVGLAMVLLASAATLGGYSVGQNLSGGVEESQEISISEAKNNFYKIQDQEYLIKISGVTENDSEEEKLKKMKETYENLPEYIKEYIRDPEKISEIENTKKEGQSSKTDEVDNSETVNKNEGEERD